MSSPDLILCLAPIFSQSAPANYHHATLITKKTKSSFCNTKARVDKSHLKCLIKLHTTINKFQEHLTERYAMFVFV